MKAIAMEVGTIRVEGRTLSFGRRAATAEGKITNANGRLLAHGTSTCLVFDIRKAADAGNASRRARLIHVAVDPC